MPFGTRAQLNFSQGGSSWEIELQVRGASDADVLLPITSCVRRVGEEDINPFNPFLPATLRTVIYDEGRTVHDLILNNDQEDIRINVLKDGTVWHRGFLFRVKGGDQISRDNPELQLVWDDALAKLRGQTLSAIGRDTLLEACFQFLDDVEMGLPLEMALGWAHVDTDTSARTRPQSWQVQYDHIQEGISYFEALGQLLRLYNMQVWQEDGKWRAYHRSVRDTTSLSLVERATGGGVSTSTIDPTVSLIDLDLARKKGGEPVKRPTVPPQSWRYAHDVSGTDWENPEFRDAATDIQGNTEPAGWRTFGGVTFDETTNELIIQGGDGVSSPSPAIAEQYWNEIVVDNTGLAGGADDFDVRIKGEIKVLDTGETGTVDVPVAEVIAERPNGNVLRYGDEGATWSSSQQYVKVQVNESDSGGSTQSFDQRVTFPAPNVAASVEGWVIRVCLVTQADPDGDGNTEIDEARFSLANTSNLQRNVGDNLRPPSMVEYTYSLSGRQERDRLSVGPSTQDEVQRPESVAGQGGIRYYDSTDSTWHLLNDAQNTQHATRSYNTGGLALKRLQDRYAQHSRQLFQIEGYVKPEKIHLRDTVEYLGRKWTVTFEEQAISRTRKRVVLTELANESVPLDLVTVSRQ